MVDPDTLAAVLLQHGREENLRNHQIASTNFIRLDHFENYKRAAVWEKRKGGEENVEVAS